MALRIAESSARGIALLRQALEIIDADAATLPEWGDIARGGFGLGAAWMAARLNELRMSALTHTELTGFGATGTIKYALCVLGALALGMIPWRVCVTPLIPLAMVFGFYAVEAQMVFVFPLRLDQDSTPWRTSRALTSDAGGTLSVMMTVLILASYMLAGGFLGRGFRRSWCAGSLAVLIWYESLACERSARAVK